MKTKLRIIFVAACAVHIAVVFAVGHYKHPTLWENGAISENLRHGFGYSISLAGDKAPSSWQAPGYPVLLFLVESLFGVSPISYLLISVLQAVLVSSMVFPISWITARWIGNGASLYGALLAAVMPAYAWYCTRLHQPAIAIALYPWLLYGWLRASEKSRWSRGILTGFLTGIGALFSPVMLGVFGLISGGFAVRNILARNWRGLRKVLAAGLCTLAALAPWTVRNYVQQGRFVPVKDSFPMELWKGNNPAATGTPMLEGGLRAMDLPPDLEARYGRITEVELMDELKRRAIAYIHAEPAAFARRVAQRVWWFWTAVPAKFLRASGEGEAIRFRWVQICAWVLLTSLASLGLLVRRNIPIEYAATFGAAIVVYSLTYGLTVVGQARYRAEIEFFLIPLAAGFIAVAVRRIRLAMAKVAESEIKSR